MRLGGSYSSGEQEFTGSPSQEYRLAGGDITVRYQDLFRAQYEYAMREEEASTSGEGKVDGQTVEVEGGIWKKPRISLVCRYDTIEHSGSFGESFTERWSWGPAITLGSSVLILNHEHWMFDTSLNNEDVIGFRWAAWF